MSFLPDALSRAVMNPYTEINGFHMPLYVHASLLGSNTAYSTVPDIPSPTLHPFFYVLIYSAIGLGFAGMGVAGNLVQLTAGLRASRRLFNELLNNVIFATIRFHDTTPSGTFEVFDQQGIFSTY